MSLALSKTVTGSLGPSASRNAECSREENHTEKSDLQCLYEGSADMSLAPTLAKGQSHTGIIHRSTHCVHSILSGSCDQESFLCFFFFSFWNKNSDWCFISQILQIIVLYFKGILREISCLLYGQVVIWSDILFSFVPSVVANIIHLEFSESPFPLCKVGKINVFWRVAVRSK